jgi:hypothetical protein
VSPAMKNVTGNTSANFTVGVKNKSGSITFSSPCGSQTLAITTR